MTHFANGGAASVCFTGWEFGHFKAGLDILATPAVAIGPFVDVTVGQYGSIHSGVTGDTSISQAALHEWITVGLRASIMA